MIHFVIYCYLIIYLVSPFSCQLFQLTVCCFFCAHTTSTTVKSCCQLVILLQLRTCVQRVLSNVCSVWVYIVIIALKASFFPVTVHVKRLAVFRSLFPQLMSVFSTYIYFKVLSFCHKVVCLCQQVLRRSCYWPQLYTLLQFNLAFAVVAAVAAAGAAAPISRAAASVYASPIPSYCPLSSCRRFLVCNMFIFTVLSCSLSFLEAVFSLIDLKRHFLSN